MRTHENNHDIEKRLSELKDVKIPQSVEKNMKNQFVEFQERLAEKKSRFAGILEFFRNLSSPRVRMAAAFAVVILVVFTTTLIKAPNSSTGNLYAAVVAQLRAMTAISYEIEIAPFTTVTVARREPGLSQITTSWGVEINTNHVSRKRLTLLHYMKRYFREEGDFKEEKSEYDAYETFKNLPDQAEEILGTKKMDGQSVEGYRVLVQDGEESIDIWVNTKDNSLTQVDINFYQDQNLVHQMHIRNFKLNDRVDLSEMSFTPPKDYQLLSEADRNETKNLMQF